jgi:hypothetical protein
LLSGIPPNSIMTRREFAFWVGFGLFNLAEKLRAQGLDRLAAAAMRVAEPAKTTAASSVKSAAAGVHWAAAGDKTWRWYERENLINGEWVLTGITTPVNKSTGERKWEPGGFLDDDLLPADIRNSDRAYVAEPTSSPPSDEPDDVPNSQLPTEKRRGRHGRPPSKWLRSLHAFELRIWLKSIEVPEAGVEGMTYWEHLTRDHLFHADRIRGLTENEQAKLHAAAHFGY